MTRLMHSAGTGRLNGRSEQLLGKFITELPASQKTRDGVLIATKLAAYPWRVTPGQYVAACRSACCLPYTKSHMILLKDLLYVFNANVREKAVLCLLRHSTNAVSVKASAS